MGIGKERPPLGQAIDIGRKSLRMTSHATDPIIEIVDGNQQGIRLGPNRPSREGKKKKDEKRRSLHGMGMNRSNLFAYSLT